MLSPRFLVVGPPRSGTTVILLALEQHTDLSVVQEVFNFDNLNTPAYAFPNGLSFFQTYAPIENTTPGSYREALIDLYAESAYYPRPIDHNLNIASDMLFERFNGFKILFQQIPTYHHLWPHLKSLDIKVVLMHRSNYLEMLLSSDLCSRTGIWHRYRPEPPPVDRGVEIATDRAESVFQMFEESYQFHREFWADRLIEVEYEEILVWDNLVEKLETFLKIKPQRLPRRLSKRTVGNPYYLIKNYNSLRDHFQNTQWAAFFSHKP